TFTVSWLFLVFFFFSSRRRHTRCLSDWSSDVCSSDLKVSIWHGALDTSVNINNAQASVAQWADLHGVRLTDARQDLAEGAVRLRDRKSTRLNSSYLGISYAVFCLKKKRIRYDESCFSI